jgi:hypothetical protein
MGRKKSSPRIAATFKARAGLALPVIIANLPFLQKSLSFMAPSFPKGEFKGHAETTNCYHFLNLLS